MKLVDRDTFELSSGRQFYALVGIIGISEDLDVSYGYDGSIVVDPDEWVDDDDATAWTVEERAELADHMIALWTAFKAAKPSPAPEPDAEQSPPWPTEQAEWA